MGDGNHKEGEDGREIKRVRIGPRRGDMPGDKDVDMEGRERVRRAGRWRWGEGLYVLSQLYTFSYIRCVTSSLSR